MNQAGPTVGLMLPAVANTDTGQLDTGRLLAAAKLAEAAGFDGVYVGDHLLHPRPILESVVALTAVAATTQRIALGTCVLLAGLRSPLWLAKQLGTLDAFAPERLRIGVGVGGEYPGEFHVAGVPLERRGARVEEVVTTMREIFGGSVRDLTDDKLGLRLEPVPKSMPPVLLAGWKEVALRRAARLADGWIGYLLTPDSFTRRRDFLLEARKELGLGEFITGMLLPVHPDAEAAGAKARAAAAWGRITSNAAAFPEKLFVAGPPDAIVEQLHTYWRQGCTEMVLSLVDQGNALPDQLAALAQEVLPQVRRFS